MPWNLRFLGNPQKYYKEWKQRSEYSPLLTDESYVKMEKAEKQKSLSLYEAMKASDYWFLPIRDGRDSDIQAKEHLLSPRAKHSFLFRPIFIQSPFPLDAQTCIFCLSFIDHKNSKSIHHMLYRVSENAIFQFRNNPHNPNLGDFCKINNFECLVDFLSFLDKEYDLKIHESKQNEKIIPKSCGMS